MTKHIQADAKHVAYQMLVQNGIQKRKAAEILGYHPNSIGQIEKAIEKKSQKIDLTSESMIRPAVRNLRKLIAAKKFGDLKGIKDSTVLGAIQTVLDRSHPKKSETEAPRMTFTQVNLALYATPGTTRCCGVPEKVHETVVCESETVPIPIED